MESRYKETIKNVRKMEFPMEAAMLCKMGAKKRLKLRETVSESDGYNSISFGAQI